jgi:hypothetical protein
MCRRLCSISERLRPKASARRLVGFSITASAKSPKGAHDISAQCAAWQAAWRPLGQAQEAQKNLLNIEDAEAKVG